MEQTIHPFQKESGFELALCDVLTQHGWEKDILVQPSEEDLVENWAQIIYDNNREQERLGNYPLTTSEMQQDGHHHQYYRHDAESELFR